MMPGSMSSPLSTRSIERSRSSSSSANLCSNWRDDLADLVADRRRIDLDVIVNHRQLAQQRLGDLAVGRDDDFAGLGVDHVERDLFAEQDVRERLGQLLVQLVLLLPLSSVDRLELALGFRRRQLLAGNLAARDETFTSITMP